MWDDLPKTIDYLVDKHNLDGENKPDFIIGMSRGGLIPAAMIATKINVPLVAAYIDKHDHLYVDKQDWLWDKNILIVDDICRTGWTLSKAYRLVKKITDGFVTTLTMYNLVEENQKKDINPDFSNTTRTDIKFPWDYDR